MQVSISDDGRASAVRMAFKVAEAASALGVSASFIRLEMSRGHLRATRLGRRVVLTKSELERYLAERSK
jgi:excisionase family DNA binding protein